MSVDRDAVVAYLENLQKKLVQELEALDGAAKFARDEWHRPEGGGGVSCILKNGALFEQGGIGFSQISGDSMPASATARRPELAGRGFEATGVSLVLHPWNPFVPTVHMNVRFFVASKAGAEPVWWFGGGFDLTPFYPVMEDIKHWHKTAQQTCEPFGDDVYPRFKQWCDEYFYLPHRKETRGVGGLFFDDLNEWPFNKCFAFLRSVGDHFLSAYVPIVKRNRDKPYTDREREFQLYRRGRYVEFNLVYDRGTLFGLQSGGRSESILMSMPPRARWEYGFEPEEDSAEAKLADFLKPRDWL